MRRIEVTNWVTRQDQHIDEIVRILAEDQKHAVEPVTHWWIEENHDIRTLVCNNLKTAAMMSLRIEGALRIFDAIHWTPNEDRDYDTGPQQPAENRLMRLIKGNLNHLHPNAKPYDEKEMEGTGRI